jgi:hypothetical protein
MPSRFQIQLVEGRTAVHQVVVPRRPHQNEEVEITGITPMRPGQVDFANIRDVLDNFLAHVAHVGFRSIQPCPFGEAYVQFVNICDRDRLIRESPIPFDDVMISFSKHNEGIN